MAKKKMSDAEFANVKKGASRVLGSKEKGAAGGYYVSRDPNVPISEGGSKEVVGPLHSEEAVKQHHEDIVAAGAQKVVPQIEGPARAATAEEQKRVHQGIWNSPDDGASYLDVSDRIGNRSSFPALGEALHRGLSQQQFAIYAAGKAVQKSESGGSLRTHTQIEGIKYPAQGARLTQNYLNQKKAQRAREKESRSSQKRPR